MKIYILIAAVWYLACPLLKEKASDEYWLICSIGATLLVCIIIILEKIEKLK